MRSLPLVLLCLAASLSADPVLDLEGEGLDVLGSTDAPSQVLVIDRQTIEDLRAADVTELLGRALGLVTVSNGGYGNQSAVKLRGLGSGRVAILIDGVPVNSAQSGDFDLSRVSAASVQRVEVIPGGADSQYNLSGAMGGVVNLITVKSSEGWGAGAEFSNKASVPSSVGSSYWDTQALSLHGSWGDGSRFANLGFEFHHAANEFSFLDEETLSQWERNGVIDGSLWSSLGFDPAPGQRLLVSANGYAAEKQIPGPVHSAVSAAGVQKEVSTRTAVVWSLGGEDWAADETLSHRLTLLDWEDAAGLTRHVLNSAGMTDRRSWTVAPWLDLSTALDLDASLLLSDAVGTKTAVTGGLAVTGEFHAGDTLRVIPSLKAQFGEVAAPIPVPKLGVEYRLGPVVLQANGFRVFKLPTLNDRYWPDDGSARGNPDLRAEDAWGADLGLTAPLFFGKLELSSYATRHTDAILWQPVSGKWTPTNIGEAFSSGGTVAWSGHNGPLSWSARYEYLLTWVLWAGFSWEDDKRMPYTPVHSGSGTLAWRTGVGTLTASVHGESERFLSPLNLYSLPPFWTLNAGWAQPLGSGWELFLDGKNVLNASYVTVEGYPMPGASLTVGTRWQMRD